MTSPDPNEFIGLFQDVTSSLLNARLNVDQHAAQPDDIVSFEHSCLRLTRCGAVLGLNTVEQGTDISSLSRDHPLRKGILDSQEMGYLTRGLRYIEGQMEEMLVSDSAVSNGHADNLRPIDSRSILPPEDVRLVQAMRQISWSRIPGSDSGTAERNFPLSLIEHNCVARIREAVSKMTDHLAHLSRSFSEFAGMEAQQLREQSLRPADVARLFDIEGSDDDYLKSASQDNIQSEPMNKDKQIAWNVNSSNYGLQLSGDIHGGTFSWTGGPSK